MGAGLSDLRVDERSGPQRLSQMHDPVGARSRLGRASLGNVMVFFTAGKWLALVVLVAAVLRSPEYRAILARRLSRFGQALWVHRLASIAILLLVFMACIPAADLLDQLPDIQRQWADGEGWWHALWAAGPEPYCIAVAPLSITRSRTAPPTTSSGRPPMFGIPPARETTSGRLATEKRARISEAVMPFVRAAYRST